jgi:hypothetical protein
MGTNSIDWGLLYKRLGEFQEKLVIPGNTPASFQRSLDSAYYVQQQVTIAHNLLLQKRADVESNLLGLRTEAKLHSSGFNIENGIHTKISEAAAFIVQCEALILCMNKVLAACKDLRNDVSKRVKLMELERVFEKD